MDIGAADNQEASVTGEGGDNDAMGSLMEMVGDLQESAPQANRSIMGADSSEVLEEEEEDTDEDEVEEEEGQPEPAEPVKRRSTAAAKPAPAPAGRTVSRRNSSR
jgi:hypothetical protein